MPVKEGVKRARVAQLIILLLNYLCLIMATLSFSHTIFQFGELVYEVVHKTKLQIPERTQVESEKRMLEESMLIRYALYCGLGVVVAVILFTILNMIAAVTEGRKLLILTLVLGSFITAASLSAAVLILLAKLKANSILAIVFETGIKKFHHLYERDAIYYQRVVDTIQTTGMCCGYDSYKDYNTLN
uniref:Tetraspanin n=1 Tax=Romanomermis culicivorax TaxID=13658 RepID=A0A915J0M8_ROMCU